MNYFPYDGQNGILSSKSNGKDVHVQQTVV